MQFLAQTSKCQLFRDTATVEFVLFPTSVASTSSTEDMYFFFFQVTACVNQCDLFGCNTLFCFYKDGSNRIFQTKSGIKKPQHCITTENVVVCLVSIFFCSDTPISSALGFLSSLFLVDTLLKHHQVLLWLLKRIPLVVCVIPSTYGIK